VIYNNILDTIGSTPVVRINKLAQGSEPGTVILAVLPDIGERYLSTPLFEGVKEGGDDELLKDL